MFIETGIYSLDTLIMLTEHIQLIAYVPVAPSYINPVLSLNLRSLTNISKVVIFNNIHFQKSNFLFALTLIIY